MPTIVTQARGIFSPGLGSRPWANYLLLALAYVVSGKLGLMLALPPGYASAIFPPAGIAVAAALIGGTATLPWTFIGSLVLNIWIGYSTNHHIDAMGLVAASAIAGASMLQAAAGGLLLRQAIGYPTRLDTGRDVLRSLLLAPIICVTSATLSVGSLAVLGIVPHSAFAENWVAWWVGDTLGVVVMLPLVLVVAGEPRALWRSRARSVALPMLAIFALLVVFFIRVNSWERDDSLLEFRALSQQAVDQIQIRLDEQESLLEQTAGLFVHDANGQVTQEEFQRFIHQTLTRHLAIQAVEWAPLVKAPQRAAFEAAQRAVRAGFEIREPATSGKMLRAGERGYFYPVTYVEPLAGNEVALGFDLASTPERRTALKRALESGKLVATAPLRLIQERGQTTGMLLLLAVKGGVGPAESGLVLSVLRMGDFMDKLLLFSRGSLQVRLSDVDAGEKLYDSFSDTSEAAQFERQFSFGGRTYRLQTAPTPVYFARHRGWQSWGVLAAGVLGTGLLGALLLLGSGHAARIEAEVRERTRELKESEDRSREITSALGEGVVVMDWTGCITFSNPEAEQLLGWTTEQLLGRNAHALLHYNRPDHTPYPEADCAIIKVILSGEVYRSEDEVFWRKDGSPLPVSVVSSPITRDGRIVGSVIAFNDVTERKNTEKALRESEALFRDTLENAPIGMALASTDGRFIKANRAMCQIVGYSEEELAGKTFQEITHPEDLGKNLDLIEQSLSGKLDSYQLEKRYIHKDGHFVWTLVTSSVVRDDSGVVRYLIGQIQDITERKRDQEQIHHLAYYDTLTDLPNRRLLLDRLNQALAQAKRHARSMAVMFLDLDQFKQVNDTLGHDVGDELLKEVAQRLGACVRKGDTLSRQGGDEFVFVLTEVSREQDAARVAEKILAALSMPFSIRGHELRVTASIGIAVNAVNGINDAQELMKRADMAMYAAKEAGRNGYRFCDCPPGVYAPRDCCSHGGDPYPQERREAALEGSEK